MYDLEIKRIIETIKEKKYKTVLIQLPDGLKPKAKDIVDTIREETNAEVIIWMASCYGSCDVPFGLESLDVDLFIQWGHNEFRREEGWGDL